MQEIYPILIDSTPVLSGASAETNLNYYFATPGRRTLKATLAAVPIAATNSDTWTVTYKLQQSPTTVDSDFVDITNAAFAAQSDSDAQQVQEVNFAMSAGYPYIRGYNTLVGAGVVPVCELFVVKREA
jgi:hypothetical protein